MAAENPSPSERAARIFALFDLEPDFELDAKSLDEALLRAGMAWHPDRFVAEGPAKQREAEDRMAAYNEAHGELARPARRAELLLEWLGLPATQGTDQDADPEFLMEMMELREEAEDARTALPADAARARAFVADLKQKEAALLDRFAEAWRAWKDAAGSGFDPTQANPDPERAEAMRRIFYELRYHQRTREQLQEALDAAA